MEWQPAFAVLGASRLLWAFIGTYLFLTVRYVRVLPRGLVVAGAVFFLGFMRSARLGPLFFVTAMPLMHEGLALAKAEIKTARLPFPWSPRKNLLLKILGTFSFLLVLGLWGVTLARTKPAVFPQKAVSILKSQVGEGGTVRLFHEYGWGGYIIKTAPEIPVFIDGRMPHWKSRVGDSIMQEYVEALYKGGERGASEGWRTVFKRHGINTVLIREYRNTFSQGRTSPPASFIEKAILALTENPRFDLETALREAGWSTIYKEAGVVLIQKL
jgi:hypothetical protein